MIRFAFCGRVSTEDAQDPESSRAWQLARARQLIDGHGEVVAQFFDIGVSRSIPWRRRPRAAELLEAIKRPDRRFDAIVIAEPQRAFYGNQFSLIFPVLVHYGVALWVPEVGGPVDPGSEAHDMVMSLYGGMSKGERQRIKTRVRASMSTMAAQTDRRLGGRPPYGYRIVDAGEHPNPAKAAAGQRLHRLEPDPIIAPVVLRIFEEFAAGKGLRHIADGLTADRIPSPSAHDPGRNPHRDPVGWAHSAVRAILANPNYSGRRVWGRQAKTEILLNPDDVAEGHTTVMRWRDPSEWIEAEEQTHEPLVPPDLIESARHWLNSHTTGQRRPRASERPYALRGLLYCAACQRRMQGAYRRNASGPGRVLYRCEIAKGRSVPAEILAAHPRTAYLNEALVLPKLDAWIASLADPVELARMQEPDPADAAKAATLRAQIKDLTKKIDALVAAIEAGADVASITEKLRKREAERALAQTRLGDLARAPGTLSPGDIEALTERLGGIATVLADAPADKRRALYESLDLRLEYDSGANKVMATTDLGVSLRGVRGGT